MTDYKALLKRSNKLAPYPRQERDVTAVALIRRATVRGSIHAHAVMNGPDADFQWHLTNAADYYEVARLMRALVEYAPDHADEVARDLWSGLNAGAVGEDLWEWAVESGVDMDALIGDTDE